MIVGYPLWPNKQSWNWNAMDVGPGRDLVGKNNLTFIEFSIEHYFSRNSRRNTWRWWTSFWDLFFTFCMVS